MGSAKRRAAAMARALADRVAAVDFPLSESAESEIRTRVWAYAEALRAVGLPPERVVVALKRVASAGGVNATSRLTSMPADLDGRDKLLTDMVNWCIERYYDRPEAADWPR